MTMTQSIKAVNALTVALASDDGEAWRVARAEAILAGEHAVRACHVAYTASREKKA